MDQTLHLSDVVLPEGVSSVELAKGEGHDLAILTIKATRASTEAAADSASEE